MEKDQFTVMQKKRLSRTNNMWMDDTATQAVIFTKLQQGSIKINR